MTTLHTIAIVTDAWFPQVNGVVRTLSRTKEELESRGYRVEVISPEGYRSVPCPTYPEIRLALFAARSVKKRLTHLKPDAVHIATEGPLGLAARRWCRRNHLPFTTSYHTRFPEYVRLRVPIPLTWSYFSNGFMDQRIGCWWPLNRWKQNWLNADSETSADGLGASIWISSHQMFNGWPRKSLCFYMLGVSRLRKISVRFWILTARALNASSVAVLN